MEAALDAVVAERLGDQEDPIPRGGAALTYPLRNLMFALNTREIRK